MASCSGGGPPAPTVPLATATPPLATASAPASPSPLHSTATPAHVMLVVLENHEYDSVIGSSDAPSLNALAREYGLATQSFATTHPSLPNYLEMVSGRTFGISTDCTTCYVEAPTIADQVTARGWDWRAYMEDMPSPCYTGDSYAGRYAKKHDPLVYFNHIRENPALCGRIQPFTGFYAALAANTLPQLVEVTPNQCDDGHDCPLRQSDKWVGAFATRVIDSGWFVDGGVLVITYDEGGSNATCCRGARGGHILTLVVSLATRGGRRLDTPLDHAGMLRGIEELLGLPLLGDAACACSGDLGPLLQG